MRELSSGGKYTISDSEKAGLSDFYGGYADEKETSGQINKIYSESGYVIDTHTAVASHVYNSLKDTLTGEETVIASTASPYKFASSVMKALSDDTEGKDDMTLIDELSSISNTDIPQAVKEIKNAPIRHKTVIEKEDMKKAVTEFLS